MKVLFYVVFSFEHVARMEVRNITEGLAMEFPQFQGLSSSTKLPGVVSDAMNLCKFYQNGRAPV